VISFRSSYRACAARGGEAEPRVGVALQLCQIVEERRLLGGGLLLRLADGPGPTAHLLRYPVRGLPLLQAVLFVFEPDAVVGVGCAFFAAEAGVDGPELLGLEVFDLFLAVNEELEGGCLDAADGEDVAWAAEADRVGTGGVHADDPIRLAAAAGRVFEGLHRAAFA
jgi:hypothetical protein